MKKTLLFILTVVYLNIAGSALERIKSTVSLKDLQDAESQNYVPYPFPQNRHHVIADFLFWVKHHYLDAAWEDRETSDIYDFILPKLVKENSDFKIGGVYKAFNIHHGFPHEQHHILEIVDSKENCYGHAAVSAEGLCLGVSLRKRPLSSGPSLEPAQVVSLMKKTGICKSDKVKVELRRMAYTALGPRPWHFCWRIRINGDEFFLQDSPVSRCLYRVCLRKKFRLRLRKHGQWQLTRENNEKLADFERKLPRGDRMILDTVNEQVTVVTPVALDVDFYINNGGLQQPAARGPQMCSCRTH